MSEVKTEQVDGLTFLVPPRSPYGTWATDEDLVTRVLAAIRERLPEHEAWEQEALTARLRRSGEESCRTFWGSHGCDRPAGHVGLHVCLDCSAIHVLTDTHAVLWWADNDDDDTVRSWQLSAHAWQWWSAS